jgi:hypothetical protein
MGLQCKEEAGDNKIFMHSSHVKSTNHTAQIIHRRIFVPALPPPRHPRSGAYLVITIAYIT